MFPVPGTDTDADSDEDEIAERGSGLQDQDFGGMYDDEDFSSPDDLQEQGKDSEQDNVTIEVSCTEVRRLELLFVVSHLHQQLLIKTTPNK